MTGEEEILAILGKIVAQWNYAEHCSRQILRKQISGGHVDDPDHIALSKKTPMWMEEELRGAVLPKWKGAPGEPYLQSLIDAFSAARDYRNHYVHGVWATAGTTPAQAVIIPGKPHKNKTQAPGFATAADMLPVATHLEALGAFACEVGNGFDASGARAKNPDGSLVVGSLPAHIAPLDPFPYAPLVP